MALEGVLYKFHKDTDIRDIQSKPWAVSTELMGKFKQANQIHRYFVENVQNGVDSRTCHNVSQEQFTELLNRCSLIESDPDCAEELLPTLSGFDFGRTAYDDTYMDTLSRALIILRYVKNNIDFDQEILFYSSSW